jgi:hypothetical protein
MRQITITFKQQGKGLVACTADFGNRDEASELENKLADASQASIATALRQLPADLLGEGYGSTEQEAEQSAKEYRDLLFHETAIISKNLRGSSESCPIG